MDFPITALMDQAACYRRLLELLHPGGLTCPRGGAGPDRYRLHRRRAGSPIVDYRCPDCRRVFNLFTGTAWQGTRLRQAGGRLTVANAPPAVRKALAVTQLDRLVEVLPT